MTLTKTLFLELIHSQFSFNIRVPNYSKNSIPGIRKSTQIIQKVTIWFEFETRIFTHLYFSTIKITKTA